MRKRNNNIINSTKDGEEIKNWNQINSVFGRVYEGNKFWALREKKIKLSDFQIKLIKTKKLISEIKASTLKMSTLLPNFDSKKPAKNQVKPKTPAKNPTKPPAKPPKTPTNTPVGKPKTWKVKCGLCSYYVMFPSSESRMKYASHVLKCGMNDHCGASNAPPQSQATCGICHVLFRFPGQRKEYEDHVKQCGMVEINGESSSGKKNQLLITDTIPYHVEKTDDPTGQIQEVDMVQERLDQVSMEDDGDDSIFRKICLEAREEVLENEETDYGVSQKSLPSTQPSQEVSEERFVENINPGDASTQDPTTPGGTKKRVRISGGEGSPKLESKVRKTKGDDTMAAEQVDVDILLRRAKYFLGQETQKTESVTSTGSSVVVIGQVEGGQKTEADVSGAQAFSQNDDTVVEVPLEESTFMENKAEDEMSKMRDHIKRLQKSLHNYISKSDLLTNELAEAHLTIEKLNDQIKKMEEGVNIRDQDVMKLRRENKNLLETLRAMNEKILNLSQIQDRKVLFEHSEAQKKKIQEKNRQIQELNAQCNEFMAMLDSREDYEALVKINEDNKQKVKILEKKVEQLEEENQRLSRSQDVSMTCNAQILKTAALQNGELQAYKKHNVDCGDPNCHNSKVCGFSHRRKELKDVPCKFYLNGFCKDGDDCLFSHHESFRGEPDGDGQDEPMELDQEPQPQGSQPQESRSQRLPRSEKRGYGGRGRGRKRRPHSYHNYDYDLHHTRQTSDSPARRKERRDHVPYVPKMPSTSSSRSSRFSRESSFSSNNSYKPKPRVRFGSDGYPLPVPAVSQGSATSSVSSGPRLRRRSSDAGRYQTRGSSTTEPYSPPTDWTPYSPDCLDKDNNFGYGEDEEEVFTFDDREVFQPTGPRRGRGHLPHPRQQNGPRSNGQNQREEHPAVVEKRISNTVQMMKEPKGILLDRVRQQRRELDIQNPWPEVDRRFSDPQTQRLRGVNHQIQRTEKTLRTQQETKKENYLQDYKRKPGGR